MFIISNRYCYFFSEMTNKIIDFVWTINLDGLASDSAIYVIINQFEK